MVTVFSGFRAQRGALCYLYYSFFRISGLETLSLLPLLLLFPHFGLREALSVTFATPFSAFRAQRRFLCYLCYSFFRISGSERRSLLPLHLLLLHFGLREALSVTFATPFSAFRAQRRFLCYLCTFFCCISGLERRSLLPLHLLLLHFGLREALSVTFATPFSAFRAQRRSLCYLCTFFCCISGLERRSLLPLHLLLLDFGLREALSFTFATPFSAFRAQRGALCYLCTFFCCISGSEKRSLLPLLLLFPDLGLRDAFSFTFAPSFAGFRAQRRSLYSLPILFFLKGEADCLYFFPTQEQ